MLDFDFHCLGKDYDMIKKGQLMYIKISCIPVSLHLKNIWIGKNKYLHIYGQEVTGTLFWNLFNLYTGYFNAPLPLHLKDCPMVFKILSSILDFKI
jgi:hypothetical protein